MTIFYGAAFIALGALLVRAERGGSGHSRSARLLRLLGVACLLLGAAELLAPAGAYKAAGAAVGALLASAVILAAYLRASRSLDGKREALQKTRQELQAALEELKSRTTAVGDAPAAEAPRRRSPDGLSLTDDTTRKAEKMRALDTVMGGAIHELNGHLSAVRGYAQLALMDEGGAAASDDFKVIREATDKSAELLRCLLEYTGGERRDAVDLNAAVLDGLRLARAAAEMRGVEVETDLSTVPLVSMHSDDVQSIVLSLFSLSVEAGGARGRDEKSVVTVSTAVSGSDAVLTVKDMSAGSAAGAASSPEARAARERVERIVSRYGGLLEMKADYHGRAFSRATLPGVPKESGDTAVIETQGQQKSFGGLRVLVVEDEESVRTLIFRYLEKRSAAVTCVASGFDAVEAFRRESFDIVLLDMNMPGMDGIECFEHLKKIRSDVSAIFVSAVADSEFREEVLARGAAACIRKPFDLASLHQSIEIVMNRKKYISYLK